MPDDSNAMNTQSYSSPIKYEKKYCCLVQVWADSAHHWSGERE
jgi:hypothetical protein